MKLHLLAITLLLSISAIHCMEEKQLTEQKELTVSQMRIELLNTLVEYLAEKHAETKRFDQPEHDDVAWLYFQPTFARNYDAQSYGSPSLYINSFDDAVVSKTYAKSKEEKQLFNKEYY